MHNSPTNRQCTDMENSVYTFRDESIKGRCGDCFHLSIFCVFIPRHSNLAGGVMFSYIIICSSVRQFVRPLPKLWRRYFVNCENEWTHVLGFILLLCVSMSVCVCDYNTYYKCNGRRPARWALAFLVACHCCLHYLYSIILTLWQIKYVCMYVDANWHKW